MTNSSEEYWDIDGTSLNQYCWAIKTLGGSRSAVPKLRGDNALLPYRHGRIFKPKTADSRVITLAMWVAGIDPATDQPSSKSQLIEFNDNLRALQDLFWSPKEQLILTKRWFTNSATPVLMQASALVELAGTMDPTMTGRTRADLGVDLLLADPFFYSPEITVPAIDADGSTVVINNPGNVEAWSSIQLEFNGELQRPTLWNMSTDPVTWMTVDTLVQPGYAVNVDVGNFNAIREYDGLEISAAIDHQGAREWFKLKPGNNTIKLTSSGISSGNVIIKYRAAFI